MKKKVSLLITLLFFCVFITKSQTIGNEGQYGISITRDYKGNINRKEATIINGEVSLYSENSANILYSGEYDHWSIGDGTGYSKTVSYYPGKSLDIEFFDNSPKRTKLKEISYELGENSSYQVSPYKSNGDLDVTKIELIRPYNGSNGDDLKKIFEEEANLARKSIVGFNPYYLTWADSITKQQFGKTSNSIDEKVKKWQSKQVISDEDCNTLFGDILSAETVKKYKQAIQLMTLHLTKCSDEDNKVSSRYYRANLYKKNSEYAKAIADLKLCEQMLKAKKNLDDEEMVYGYLVECYDALGDATNSKLYYAKKEQVSKKQTEIGIANTPSMSSSQQKNYCVTTYKGNYKISLTDDGSFKALYISYDNNGNTLKTVQGKWILRDEGVYGSAYMLTFEFTGANSNLPSMKFNCQIDGNGQIQALIDNQSRTWSQCR